MSIMTLKVQIVVAQEKTSQSSNGVLANESSFDEEGGEEDEFDDEDWEDSD